MTRWVHLDDLKSFTTADPGLLEGLVEDAEAFAVLMIPALASQTLSTEQDAAVKAIIRAAVVRRAEGGSGVVTQQSSTSGPFTVAQSVDTRSSQSKLMFWPSELDALRKIAGVNSGKAFSADQAYMADADPLTQRPDLRFQWD